MEIKVHKSGGFGAPTTDEDWGPIDTDSSDSGARLVELVESVGFLELPERYPPQGPDRFNYTTTVTDGDRTHSVTFSEDSEDVPAQLKEIVESVRRTS